MRSGLQISFGILFLICLLLAVCLQQGAFFLLPYAALFIFVAVYYPSAAWFALIFMLPLSMEVNFNEMLGTDLPDEPVMILLTGIFLLAMLARQLNNTETLIKHPVFFLVLLLWLWSVCSAAFSSFPLMSLKYVLAKTWYIIPFMTMPFFVIRESEQVKRLAACLLAPMGVTVLYILFRHAQRGFLFDDANHVVQPFFRNHVNYSAMLVCLMPVLYFCAQGAGGKRMKIFLHAALLIFLAALFFSFSRGAWLALVVGIVAAVLIKWKMLPQFFVLAMAGAIIAIAWFAKDNRYLNYHHNYKKTIYHKDFSDHMQATFRNTDLSNAERVYRWIAAIRMSGDHPLTGFGPGTFYRNYQPYGVSYFKTWVSNNPEHSTVHNYFLLLLTEQGIPALVIFVVLLWMMFAQAQRLYHRLTDPLYKITALCTGIMLAMIVTVNMLSDLVETDKIGSLFYLCCGMLIVLERFLNEPQSKDLSV